MRELADPAPVWQARTGASAGAGSTFQAFSQSVEEDGHLLEVDLAGSIAHALGLAKAGLITTKQAHQLVTGLQDLHKLAHHGGLQLDPGLEDVHMNLEHQLGEQIGEVAGHLHTGRSRNDQVALDLVLHHRLAAVTTAEGAHALAVALHQLACEHLGTPWVLHTHGQPAQPATLGLLLHAHAARFAQLAQEALALATGLVESPLGSGAGAGSTLPLDPAYTAGLLGLDPPKSALLATSSRAPSLSLAQLFAHVGIATSSLAQELFLLHQAGHVQLPEAHTTGSSLMPQKKNPDALELVRATGNQLTSLPQAITPVLTGLPLGYHRDLQQAKAPVLEATGTAHTVLELLLEAVAGLSVDEASLDPLMATPGILATDAAEALVRAGVPFRQAYTLVAQAHAQAEEGTPVQEALADQDLPQPALEAALDALDGNGPARATPGGPAPAALTPALEALADQLDELASGIETAKGTAETPLALLEQPVDALLATLDGGQA